MTKRVTIKDIAKISGYSVNCVSRALMGAQDISATTKQKIKQIADELGYVRNGSAAALRHGKSKTVAVLFDSLLNPFYYIMTNYLWDILLQEGYSIITFKSDIYLFEESMAKRMVSVNVDGVLSFLQPTDGALDVLNSSNTPLVVIGRKTYGACDSIVLNNYKGGFVAAENLIRRGYKRPLYLGESKELECSEQRCKGFLDAFSNVGITANAQFLTSSIPYKWAAYIKTLYENNSLPDSIFCFCDYIAYEVLSAINQCNVFGIAIIGFDNIQHEVYMPGTLTTISYDKRRIAVTAVQALLDKISGITTGRYKETLIDDLTVSYTKLL